METYIIAGYRTAAGKAPKGSLRFTRPDDLAIATIKHLMKAVPEIESGQISDVMVGHGTPGAEPGLNVGRLMSLSGLNTLDVPAMTVHRYCASGVETIAIADS